MENNEGPKPQTLAGVVDKKSLLNKLINKLEQPETGSNSASPTETDKKDQANNG